MADDIRISQTDIGRIEAAERKVADAVRKVDAAQLARVGRQLASKVDQAVGTVLRNLDEITARLGVTDRDTIANVRRGLETVEGATSGVQATAGLLAALPLPPHARLAVLAGAAVIGGLNGFTAAEIQRRVDELKRAQDEDVAHTIERLRASEGEARRRDAAARRAKAAR